MYRLDRIGITTHGNDTIRTEIQDTPANFTDPAATSSVILGLTASLKTSLDDVSFISDATAAVPANRFFLVGQCLNIRDPQLSSYEAIEYSVRAITDVASLGETIPLAFAATSPNAPGATPGAILGDPIHQLPLDHSIINQGSSELGNFSATGVISMGGPVFSTDYIYCGVGLYFKSAATLNSIQAQISLRRWTDQPDYPIYPNITL